MARSLTPGERPSPAKTNDERAPLIVLSPLFGLMLAMVPKPLALVAATLAAGTPALTMIGAIGAALTVPDGGAGAAADHSG